MADFKFELHSPITEEEWDLITDVDLDHTPSVMFHTKHGKDVEYIKVKHGRWLYREEHFAFEKEPRITAGCSECGHSMFSKHDTLNYCPNCGARMQSTMGQVKVDVSIKKPTKRWDACGLTENSVLVDSGARGEKVDEVENG